MIDSFILTNRAWIRLRGRGDFLLLVADSLADKKLRTIYEYHRVEIVQKEITNHTAVIITPEPSEYRTEPPGGSAGGTALVPSDGR